MSRPRPGTLASRLGGSGQATVLVVEDEPDIAAFLAAFFRASGTELVSLDPIDAADVVDRAASTGAACVLLDLNLSGLSGFAVMEALAADPRVAETPVLVITGDCRAATQERAADLGAVGFVPKPFNVKDLFLTVQELVGSRLGDGAVLITAEAVNQRLARTVSDARRGGRPATFALVQLVGAAASPVVVDEAARRLEATLPGAEVIGATGADQLAVLFAGAGADDAVAALAGALPDGRLGLELAADRSVTVDIRVGVAATPDHAATAEELYMAADIALGDALDGPEPIATAR
jgi:DNA-binding response OmpR family regulator